MYCWLSTTTYPIAVNLKVRVATSLVLPWVWLLPGPQHGRNPTGSCSAMVAVVAVATASGIDHRRDRQLPASSYQPGERLARQRQIQFRGTSSSARPSWSAADRRASAAYYMLGGYLVNFGCLHLCWTPSHPCADSGRGWSGRHSEPYK